MVFLTLEGLDGSGKSTQLALLREWLAASGREVVATREPGGTEVGERVRELVLNGPDMTAWPEALLYAAARAELVATVVRPALERGAVVVSDRYVDSSLAYQGVARGLGIEQVYELNMAVVGGLLPQRTFLLRVDASRAVGRVQGEPDRIEREALDFHRRVDEGFLEVAARFPERIAVLDGTLPPEELAARIRADVEALLAGAAAGTAGVRP